VRGPLSEKALDKKIGVYGDPALLLPLIYNPDIKQKYEVGYTPHYIDKKMFPAKLLKDNELFIDVQDDWRSIVKNIKSCKKIVSSSLHGIIVAEAYGIPAEWVEYSDKVIGKGFKFRDYFLGTGRVIDKPGNIQPMENLKEVQEKLLAALTSHYKKS
jgi:pyruvyltransferase